MAGSSNQIVQVYDSYAVNGYPILGLMPRFMEKSFEDIAELVEQLAMDIDDPCVLDLACGTGILAYMLAKRGMSVVACDLSPKMIEVAKSTAAHENIIYMVQDAHTITPQDIGKNVDVVVAKNALYHMDPAQVFEAVSNLLVPSGYFIFSTLNADANDIRLQLRLMGTAMYDGLVRSPFEALIRKRSLNEVIEMWRMMRPNIRHQREVRNIANPPMPIEQLRGLLEQYSLQVRQSMPNHYAGSQYLVVVQKLA